MKLRVAAWWGTAEEPGRLVLRVRSYRTCLEVHQYRDEVAVSSSFLLPSSLEPDLFRGRISNRFECAQNISYPSTGQ